MSEANPTTNTPGSATLIRGTIVTMNARREIIDDGTVCVDDGRIVAVGGFAAMRQAYPDAETAGSPSDLVLPGYVNGHQHLTGDRLIQSSIPDDLEPGESIFSWAVPVHAAHSGDDDELSALLTLSESLMNGITSTFEAGTVAFPDRVVAAAERVGARLTIGSWGWDVDEGPYAGSVDEVIDRQRSLLAIAEGAGNRISAWVTLVGHDLMSDDLVVAATALARERGVGMTFHMSPGVGDPESYLARTGKRPVLHLDDLGVLGPHLAIAHGVHLDDAEVEVLVDRQAAVVSCPWAYLRLGQGMTEQFRHLDIWKRHGRLALGCDSENAGDMVDGVRTAALFAGLAKDTSMDPTIFGGHDALELLTIKGAQALGIDDRVGSIEVGKEADLVVHDRTNIEWIPPSPDPVLQLIWGSDGRSVRDVYVAGEQVVADRQVVKVDVPSLAAEAAAAGDSLRSRSGVPTTSRW